MDCNYCNKKTELVSGRKLYPNYKELHSKLFHYCADCQAWVGCHVDSDMPLGILANKELRTKRLIAHKYFDKIFTSGKMERNEAYEWLASQLGIERKYCHIGMFNIDKCNKTIHLSKGFKL